MCDNKRCHCDSCVEHGKYKEIRKFLEFNGVQYVEDFEKMYSDLVHISMDREHISAILDGSWPSSADYMEANGWVRKESVDEDNGYIYWIRSTNRKGEAIFEGKAKYLDKTLFGTVYKGVDGKVYEIRNQNAYSKDYARRINNDE